MTAGSTALCVFRLGEQMLAVDATHVQEVLHGAKVTPVSRAPRSVAGVVNLRGEILTAIDLRVRFALPAPQPAASLLLRGEAEVTCVLVDAVLDVVIVSARERETAPTALDAETQSVVVGAYQRADGLILEVDPQALVEVVSGDRRTETR